MRVCFLLEFVDADQKVRAFKDDGDVVSLFTNPYIPPTGLELTDTLDRAMDLIVAHPSRLREVLVSSYAEDSVLAINDMTDTGYLYEHIKKYLALGIPVLKRCVYRDPLIYLQGFQGWNYQARLVQPGSYPEVPNTVYLTYRQLQNIFLAPNYGTWSRLGGLRDVGGHGLREVDVGFAGTTNYGWTDVEYHRRMCVAALNSLKVNLPSVNVEVYTDRFYSAFDYHSRLRHTKICVSPWGYGAMTHRDFEAVLAGCVVVKPDTSWLRTYPDVYDLPGMFTPCDPVFKTLQTCVEHVLENYKKYQNIAYSNRCWLRESVSPERTALYWDQLFDRVYLAGKFLHEIRHDLLNDLILQNKPQ